MLREMYRSCPRVYYEPKGIGMYLARITLKDGRFVEIPYEVENRTPHDFIIHFVIRWIYGPREIQEITLWKDREYFESYIPKEGWFKREK